MLERRLSRRELQDENAVFRGALYHVLGIAKAAMHREPMWREALRAIEQVTVQALQERIPTDR